MFFSAALRKTPLKLALDSKTKEEMKAVVRKYSNEDSASIKVLFSQFVNYHMKFDNSFVKVKENEILFLEYIDSSISEDSFNCSVAEIEDKVVGYCVSKIEEKPPVYPDPTYGYIENLCTSEEYQRQGIGLLLVQDAFAWFKTRDVSRIECFAAIQNPKSTSFWRKLGFQSIMEQMYFQI